MDSMWDEAMKELLRDELRSLVLDAYEMGKRDGQVCHYPIPEADCYDGDIHPAHIWFTKNRETRRCLGQETSAYG